MFYWSIPYHIVYIYITIYCVTLCFMSIIWYDVTSYHIILYCIVLYDINHTILYHIILYYTRLFYTLYYILYMKMISASSLLDEAPWLNQWPFTPQVIGTSWKLGSQVPHGASSQPGRWRGRYRCPDSLWGISHYQESLGCQ